MEIAKYHRKEAYLLSHVDRSHTDPNTPRPREVTPNMSNIDPSRSHLNFNLAPHNRRLNEQIAYITDVTGKRPKSNAVLFFSTWVVMPKQYEAHDRDLDFVRHFFQDIYDTLLLYYSLEPDDLASAWVHVDETRPHIHFYAAPIYREEGLMPRNNYDDVVPKRKYWHLHPFVEDMMKEKGWKDIQMMNGRTREGNWAVRDLKRNGALEKLKELNQSLTESQARLDQVNAEANNQAELLREFEEKLREKEARLQELESGVTEKQNQLNELNRNVLIERTKAYRAKDTPKDPETELLLSHKDDIKKLLLSRPDILTPKERAELQKSLGKDRHGIQKRTAGKGRILL